MQGGWWQGGDYTKATVWGAWVVNDLLTAYQQTPALWSDAMGLPESGNGLPDIVDEAKWELDWLLRMAERDALGVTKYVSCFRFSSRM